MTDQEKNVQRKVGALSALVEIADMCKFFQESQEPIDPEELRGFITRRVISILQDPDTCGLALAELLAIARRKPEMADRFRKILGVDIDDADKFPDADDDF